MGVCDPRLPGVGLPQTTKTGNAIEFFAPHILNGGKVQESKLFFIVGALNVLHGCFCNNQPDLGHVTPVPPDPHHPQFVRVPGTTAKTVFTLESTPSHDIIHMFGAM